MNRRNFLNNVSKATLATMGINAPAFGLENDINSYRIDRPQIDHIIWLFQAGGMASTETFDPKEYTPFETGVDLNKVTSTFKSIPTSVDDLRISEGLENMAEVMHLGSLIRSYQAAELGNILHTRHQFHFHTAYEPPQSIDVPHIGAWVSKLAGALNPVFPNWINIGQVFDKGEKEELRAFHTSGVLGAEHSPFIIPDITRGLDSVKPPKGMSYARFEKRNQIYKNLLDNSPYSDQLSGYQTESFARSMEQAYRLVKSPQADAFDLSKEDKETYDTYNTGKFGLGCLAARRLVERGARFITVSSNYIPFEGWDTHTNGHVVAEEMKRQIDRPVATLIKELRERGLLERTLVIMGSEFSRDAMTEGTQDNPVKDQVKYKGSSARNIKQYGLHRHFTDSGSLLMFGGPVKKGFVYGKTQDERPAITVENPVKIGNVHQTIYQMLGYSPETQILHEKRPLYTTQDGTWKAIKDLLI